MSSWFFNVIENVGLVTGILGFLLVSLSIFCYRIFRNQRVLRHQITQLQNEMKAINSGNVGMGRKINRFAEEIASVEMTHLDQSPAPRKEKNYQQAGLLLARGATIEEVVESCDIAPAEAELLAIMKHSMPKNAVAA